MNAHTASTKDGLQLNGLIELTTLLNSSAVTKLIGKIPYSSPQEGDRVFQGNLPVGPTALRLAAGMHHLRTKLTIMKARLAGELDREKRALLIKKGEKLASQYHLVCSLYIIELQTAVGEYGPVIVLRKGDIPVVTEADYNGYCSGIENAHDDILHDIQANAGGSAEKPSRRRHSSAVFPDIDEIVAGMEGLGAHRSGATAGEFVERLKEAFGGRVEIFTA